MIGRDGWAGLVVLAACAVLYWLTLDLKGNPLVPIGPAFYPRIVIGVAALFAVLLVIEDALAGRTRAVAAAAVRPNYGLVALEFAVFGLYVIALPYLGFRVATFLYVIAAAAPLARPRGGIGWLWILLLAAITAGLTYFVFERYLTVLLPRGRWTGF
jgi:putative tricarboxylic transport membrane protein